ncbi:MAG: RNA polymerase sigma factor [Planctomycetes bacterium]|nr:RNA polymerase sigma factor [Planctomycetota bacterium]
MLESDKEDIADIEAVLNGEEEGYARIVERHNVAIQKQMRNFCRDPGLAEELAQDVFVEAYLGLAKFRGEAPFRHWLARIATLTGYKYWKRKDKEKNRIPLSETMELTAAEPAPAGDPEAAAELLHDLLGALGADDRVVMTLMYLENLSQNEIAERMGWTRVMVAVRIHRAKERLRRLGEKEPWKGRLEWMLS